MLGLVIAIFIPFAGNVHLFDWDEINFAEAAREMLVTGDYVTMQINFKPFWEKPPLFIWMQLFSMKLFGVNEFAARFPNALAGVFTLVFLYNFGKRVRNSDFAIVWCLIYMASFLPFFYFKSGIIDPWFNLFISSGCGYFLLYQFKRKHFKELHLAHHPSYYVVLSGLLIGLGILTKGPVALLIYGAFVGVYFIITMFDKFFKFKDLLLLILSVALVTALWFGYEVWRNGWWFVKEFVVYQIRLFKTQDAGHGGPFYYHWVVLLFGCFPASAFMIDEFFRAENKEGHKHLLKLGMIAQFFIVLVLFSIVKTKIVHYSSFCYFPLSYLAAVNIYRLLKEETGFTEIHKSILLVTGGVLTLLFVLLPIVGMNIADIIPYVKDKFAVGNMQAEVTWEWYYFVPGVLLLVVIVYTLTLFSKNKLKEAVLALSWGNIVVMIVAVALFPPNIEAYSQRAAIEFYQSLKGKDVYVQPLGFKSYAHLFYSEKQPQTNPNHAETYWLLTADIDKDAYFVSKNISEQEYAQFASSGLEIIGRKNGFVFYRRLSKQNRISQ